MPVSTRSQIVNEDRREANNVSIQFRNHHHHGLKEKMKDLMLLYEQQKKASLRNMSPKLEEKRFSTHPSIDLHNSCQREDKDRNLKEKENLENVNLRPKEKLSSVVARTYVLPLPPGDDSKENHVLDPGLGPDRVIGFSTCPRRESVVRKLSMGDPVACQTEPKIVLGVKNEQETEKLETVSKKNVNVGGGGGGGSRIQVFVRLRPMNKKEKEAGLRCCVRIVNRRDVYLTEFVNENDYLRLKRLRGRHFTFDASFPDSASQQDVYFTSTAELVEAVLQGRNGSVFCYGATGAGKTYTMLGTLENPGVMVLAIKDLFTKIRQRSCDGNHVVQLSYLEVYNETVRDLLSPGRPLVLREDKQGIVAAGITQYRAYSTDEVMALLQRGNQNRTTEPTRANETSSRSHAILQVVVEYRIKDASTNVVNRVGKLSLIDLAGSERALATDQRTLRSLEGANINRSLLALSSCINALVEGKKHIPYRNSKLTQLLKDSLGGICNTVMIANISPSSLSFGETQNTLHWADRTKEIRTKASVANEEILAPESEADQAKLLLELQKENRKLRVQLANQHKKLLAMQAQSLAANASPTPSVSSLLTPLSTTRTNEKQKLRPSFMTTACFTPDTRKKGGGDEAVRELKQTVKTLEAEIEKMKKDHALQLQQKEGIILELSQKSDKDKPSAQGIKSIVTRASLRPKEPVTGELKSSNHRFKSPAPTAKKRSFWDITTANSPSVAKVNARNTRTLVAGEPASASLRLLQPGFARQKA